MPRIGPSLAIGSHHLAGGGGPPPANQLPQQDSIVSRFRTDTLPVVADGTAVSSWTDMVSGATITQATGANQPLYKTNRFNGKPSLLFDGVNDYLAGTVVAMNTAVTNKEFSLLVVYANAQATAFGFIASLTNSTGLNISNNGSNAGIAVNPLTNNAPTGFATGMFTLTASYNALAARGPMYVNGQVKGASLATAYVPTNLGIGASPTGVGPFKGEVLEIIMWSRRLTAYEALQAEMAIRDYYAQSYPWSADSYIYLATGDSQTYGYGSSDYAKLGWPRLYAAAKGLSHGAWANHGYIGANATMVNTIINGERLKDITTLTGKPVKFSYFEFYNQRTGITTPVGSSTSVIATQTVLNTIHSVAGNKVAFGTALDYFNRASVKSDWTNYWDDSGNRAGYMDAYVPLHTDNLVGVDGTCGNSPPFGTGFNANLNVGAITGASGASGTNTINGTGTSGSIVAAAGDYIIGTFVPANTYITNVAGGTYTLSANLTGAAPATVNIQRGDGVHPGDTGYARIATLWDAMDTM